MIMGSEFSFFFFPFDSAACFGWLFAGRWGCNSHLCSLFCPHYISWHKGLEKDCVETLPEDSVGFGSCLNALFFFNHYFSDRLQQMPNGKFFKNNRNEWQMQNTFSIFTTRTLWAVPVMFSVPLLGDPGWGDFSPFAHLCNTYLQRNNSAVSFYWFVPFASSHEPSQLR